MRLADSYRIRRHALGDGVYGFQSKLFYPGPLAVDHAGILHAVGHEDIQVAEWTEFALPAGVWVCTQNYEGDGWGLTVAFRPQHLTDEIVFMHMNSVSKKVYVGGTYGSGQIIGDTGGKPGVAPGVTPEYSGGAHLHVAYSEDVKLHMFRTYGRDCFTVGVTDWAYNQPAVAGGNTFRRGRTTRI